MSISWSHFKSGHQLEIHLPPSIHVTMFYLMLFPQVHVTGSTGSGRKNKKETWRKFQWIDPSAEHSLAQQKHRLCILHSGPQALLSWCHTKQKPDFWKLHAQDSNQILLDSGLYRWRIQRHTDLRQPVKSSGLWAQRPVWKRHFVIKEELCTHCQERHFGPEYKKQPITHISLLGTSLGFC